MSIARLFLALIVLYAPAVTSGPEAWADTITQDAVFETTGQSMWQPGNAAFTFQDSFFLGPSWHGPFSDSLTVPTPPPVPGLLTLTGGLNPGRAGLELGVQATSGSVDVAYPVKLTYTAPSSARRGSIISVGTGSAPTGTPLLKTLGPALQANLDAVVNIDAAIGGTLNPLLGPAISATLPLTTFGEQRVTLVSVGSGSTGVGFSFPGVPLGISANVPGALNLTTNDLQADLGLTVGGAANPPIVSLDVDLVTLLTTVANLAGIPIPPLNGSLELGIAEIAYAILSAPINVGPKFRQDFEFDFKGLDITLTANTGETHTGHVGDSFDFSLPAVGDLVIDSLVTLDHAFVNKTGLALGADLNFSILSANASLFGVSLVNLGPLFAIDPVPLFETSPLYLFESTFPLQGFDPVAAQLRIDVVRGPPTLVLVAAALGLAVVASLQVPRFPMGQFRILLARLAFGAASRPIVGVTALILLSGSAAVGAPIFDYPGVPRHRNHVSWSAPGAPGGRDFHHHHFHKSAHQAAPPDALPGHDVAHELSGTRTNEPDYDPYSVWVNERYLVFDGSSGKAASELFSHGFVIEDNRHMPEFQFVGAPATFSLFGNDGTATFDPRPFVRQAFKTWSDLEVDDPHLRMGLAFREVTDDGDAAEIAVSFVDFLDGATAEWSPTDRTLQFRRYADAALTMPMRWHTGAVADFPGNAADRRDLLDVGIHEVGHIVGLDHVPDGDDIMIPRALGTNLRTLSGDDILGARDLYSIPTGPVPAPASLQLIGVGLLTAFLGSGCRYLVSKRRGRRSARSTKPA